MHFRDATIDDIDAVVALLADDTLGAAREQYETPLPQAYVSAFEDLSDQPGNHLIVAVDDAGAVKACLQLTMTPFISHQGMKRATIEGVRVARDLRGEGLGKKLLEYAIEEARAAGCGLMQLSSDRTRGDAQRFYEGLGFEASHTGMKLKL